MENLKESMPEELKKEMEGMEKVEEQVSTAAGESSAEGADERKEKEIPEKLLNPEQEQALATVLERSPEAVDFSKKGLSLEEVNQEFKQEKEEIVQAMIDGAVERHRKFVETELAGIIENEDKALKLGIALEQQIIKEEAQPYLNGEIDHLDLSHIRIWYMITRFQDENGKERMLVTNFEVEGREVNNEKLTDEDEKKDIEEAKEQGEDRETTR